METAVRLAIGTAGFSIAYIYPFIAALRGRPTNELVSWNWVSQITFVIVVCIGLPKAGNYFSEQLGQNLLMWVADTPNLGLVVLFGWTSPLLAVAMARFFQRFVRGKRDHSCGTQKQVSAAQSGFGSRKSL